MSQLTPDLHLFYISGLRPTDVRPVPVPVPVPGPYLSQRAQGIIHSPRAFSENDTVFDDDFENATLIDEATGEVFGFGKLLAPPPCWTTFTSRADAHRWPTHAVHSKLCKKKQNFF